jgi:hypothetical protein
MNSKAGSSGVAAVLLILILELGPAVTDIRIPSPAD